MRHIHTCEELSDSRGRLGPKSFHCILLSWRGRRVARQTIIHREARFSPGDQCYHWNNNCESYWRVGVAMGESMLELISPED